MKIKGHVTLTFVDSESGEVLEVRESENIFTTGGWRFASEGTSISHTSYDAIQLMTVPVADEVLMNSNHGRHGPLGSNTGKIGGSQEAGFPVITAETPTTPIILENRYRFSEPGAGAGTRTIYGIMFGSGVNGLDDTYHWAYTKLTPPCTQGELVVLFVNYRIQVFETSTGTGITGFTRSTDMREIVMRSFMRGYAGRPYHATTLPTPVVPDGYMYAGWSGSTNTNNWTQFGGTGDNTWIREFYKRRIIHDMTKSENIGFVFQSHAFGSTSSGDAVNHRHSCWGPATPPNFPNKPIQPIHNHSATAYNPFLEVTNLASGNGAFSVDGSAWTDPDLPMIYRVDAITTGDVGVSSYIVRKRRHRGVHQYRTHNSPTYAVAYGYEPDTAAVIPWFSWYYMDRGKETFPGGHGQHPETNFEEWFDPTQPTDVGRVVVWNGGSQSVINEGRSPDDGITLISLIDGTYDVFDGSSTPPLPGIADVRQVAVDDDGNIWIACAGSGLWRIQDPRGTGTGPTVTKITAAMGLPDDTKCFAVAQGYNNSIWCIVDGGVGTGLCECTAPNAVTPAFVTHPFVWTTNGGISNSNWGQVRLMRIDRNSPNNEMIIQYAHVSNIALRRAYHCWWDTSLGGGNATDGGNGAYLLSTDGGQAITGGLRCSRYGRLWILNYNYTGNATNSNWKLTYGSSTWTTLSLGNTPQYTYRGVCFFYDAYNKPYVIGKGWNSSHGPTAMWDAYGSTLGPERGMGNLHMCHGHRFHAERPENRLGNMFVEMGQYMEPGWTWSGNTGIRPGHQCWDYRHAQPFPNTHFQSSGANFVGSDSLSSKHSVLQEFAWETYHWNGASWVAGWNQAGTEVAGFFPPGAADGVRVNFDCEDHTFYGRQRMEITGAFPPALWVPPTSGQSLTFACQITPQPKLAHQEAPRTLFSYYDPATGFNYTLLWDDGAGNIVLFENATPIGPFGPTPADGVPYNIVWVITDGGGPPGTTELFVNGVSLTAGPIPLIAPVVDFNNLGGVAEAYVGAGREDMTSYDYAESHFFSGTIENVILDPVPWSIGGGQVPAHNAAPLTYLGVAAQARWPMANGIGAVPLVESKATHASSDPLIDGLTIQFSDGTASPAFVATDFYTFGAVDGIWKDNATTARTEFDIFFKPVDYDFADIEDTLNSPGTVPPAISASGGYVLDPVVWREKARCWTHTVPGQIGQWGGGHSGGVAESFQVMSGDGYVEFKPAAQNANVSVGFYDTVGNAWKAYFTLSNNGTWTIYAESGSTGVSGSYTAEDTFRVQRNGTDWEFYHNAGLEHTKSSGVFTGSVVVRWGSSTQYSYNSTCVYDVNIYWNRPAYILDLGLSGTNTGKYDPDYLTCDELPEAMEFTLSGYGTNATVSSDYTNVSDSLSLPGPNEVLVIPDAGIAVFNSGDVGRTVTCKYIVIRDK